MNNAAFPSQLCKLRQTETLWERLRETHQCDHRIPYGMLIVGKSGVGKTALAKAYQESFPPIETPEKKIFPVVYVALTETRSPKGLVEQLVNAFNITRFNRATTLLSLQERLLNLIKVHKVEFFIIDEVQECIPTSYGRARQDIVKQITWLINETKLPFAFFGTPIAKELVSFSSDTYKDEEQLSRRLYAPLQLSAIPPMSASWMDSINFFLLKRDHPPLDKQYNSHQTLMNRLYLATSGKFGLLEKFMLHLPTGLNLLDEHAHEVLTAAYRKTISTSPLSPFDDKDFGMVELAHHMQRLKSEYITSIAEFA